MAEYARKIPTLFLLFLRSQDKNWGNVASFCGFPYSSFVQSNMPHYASPKSTNHGHFKVTLYPLQTYVGHELRRTSRWYLAWAIRMLPSYDAPHELFRHLTKIYQTSHVAPVHWVERVDSAYRARPTPTTYLLPQVGPPRTFLSRGVWWRQW